MIEYGNMCVIIGSAKSGKTILSKTLAKSLSFDFVYIDYSTTNSEYLYDYYDVNKYRKKIIIFDNYYRSLSNDKIDNLFIKNKRFTLIYTMNHFDVSMLNKTDIIYIAKDENDNYINNCYEKLKIYNNDLSLDYISESMKNLKQYGFIVFNKDKHITKKEMYLKI
jgi:hypothetical protein